MKKIDTLFFHLIWVGAGLADIWFAAWTKRHVLPRSTFGIMCWGGIAIIGFAVLASFRDYLRHHDKANPPFAASAQRLIVICLLVAGALGGAWLLMGATRRMIL